MTPKEKALKECKHVFTKDYCSIDAIDIALREQAKHKEQELIKNLTHGWYDECPFTKECFINIITDIMRSKND